MMITKQIPLLALCLAVIHGFLIAPKPEAEGPATMEELLLKRKADQNLKGKRSLMQVQEGPPPFAPTVVSVGDEFTKSSKLDVSYTSALATQLKALTETDWDVQNFGNSDDGAVQKTDNHTFWYTAQYNRSRLVTDVEFVVMMFGHNDAKQSSWNEDNFKSSYVDLCNDFKDVASQKVYVVVPPPMYKDEKTGIRQFIVNDHITKLLPGIAESCGATLINAFDHMGSNALSRQDLFCDGTLCD
jgi:lysophospholipase L1-like esterase